MLYAKHPTASVRGFVRLTIGQTLPRDTFDRFCSTRLVVDAKRHALVVSEIKFAKVTLKVLRAYMVIGADDAAFED